MYPAGFLTPGGFALGLIEVEVEDIAECFEDTGWQEETKLGTAAVPEERARAWAMERGLTVLLGSYLKIELLALSTKLTSDVPFQTHNSEC